MKLGGGMCVCDICNLFWGEALGEQWMGFFCFRREGREGGDGLVGQAYACRAFAAKRRKTHMGPAGDDPRRISLLIAPKRPGKWAVTFISAQPAEEVCHYTLHLSRALWGQIITGKLISIHGYNRRMKFWRTSDIIHQTQWTENNLPVYTNTLGQALSSRIPITPSLIPSNHIPKIYHETCRKL